MNEIGQKLREAREEKGLSLKDVSEKTRIRTIYLEALEAGNFDRIPGMVYVKGFIKSYAKAVDLDPTELLNHYQQNLEPEPEEEEDLSEVRVKPRKKSKVGRNIVIAILVLAIVGAAFFVGKTVWQTIQTETIPHLNEKSEDESTTDSTESDKADQTDTTSQNTLNQDASNQDTTNHNIAKKDNEQKIKEKKELDISQSNTENEPQSTSTPASQTQTESKPKVDRVNNKSTRSDKNSLEIRANQKVWVRVSESGEILYQGMLAKNEKRVFKGKRFQLRTYNGNAINVTLDGEELGSLGKKGQYVEKVFGE